MLQDFAQNTNNMMQLCPKKKCCTYIKNQQAWASGFINMHISDQSHCVFLAGGESLVDFVGSSESIDTDWPAVRIQHLYCKVYCIQHLY